MNLQDLITQKHDVKNAEALGNYLERHPEKIDELVQLLLREQEQKKIQLIAWGIGKVVLHKKHHLHLQLPFILKLIKQPKHPSVRRNLLKLLSAYDFKHFKEEELGQIWDMCASNMSTLHEPSSHHAYAMSIMEQIIYLYPELFQEFKALMDLHEETMSAAVKSRKKHVLKRLKQKGIQ